LSSSFRSIKRFNADERGQAMTEYIILVVALFIGLIPIIGALQEAFERYYGFLATWISMPIP